MEKRNHRLSQSHTTAEPRIEHCFVKKLKKNISIHTKKPTHTDFIDVLDTEVEPDSPLSTLLWPPIPAQNYITFQTVCHHHKNIEGPL